MFLFTQYEPCGLCNDAAISSMFLSCYNLDTCGGVQTPEPVPCPTPQAQGGMFSSSLSQQQQHMVRSADVGPWGQREKEETLTQCIKKSVTHIKWRSFMNEVPSS